MDPATAFSLAAGVVQLIDCGIKTSKALSEIYKRGTTAANASLTHDSTLLESTTSTLIEHLNPSTSQLGSLQPDQQHLHQIAKECSDLAQDLLSRLDAIKLQCDARKWEVPKAWWKGFKQKPKIDKIQKDLERHQELLNSEMLANVCRGMDSLNLQQLRSIKEVDINRLQSSEYYRKLNQSFRKLTERVQLRLLEDGKETRDLIKTEFKSQNDHDHHKALLDSLHYTTITSREEMIPEAYSKTFDWIMEDSSDETYEVLSESDEPVSPDPPSWRSQLPDWLKSDDSIYWINGKAGSGKSTLINFVANHPKLQDCLQSWAKQDEIIQPTFYFWRAGTIEQKSLNGLLRALMYQVLSQKPSLYMHLTQGENAHSWTNDRLRKSLLRILTQAQSIRFCFILDGLDEFEGEYDHQQELITFVQNLARYGNVKFIVSSRPEQALYNAFSENKGLRLQDLNYQDIHSYVHGKLLDKPHIQDLLSTTPNRVEDLIERVVEKADGVFLWAYIAVQDLLGGAEAMDSIGLLEDRLEYLDSSLDGIFAQQVEKIQPVHRKSAASYLALMLNIIKEMGDDNVKTAHFAFAFHQEFALEMESLLTQEGPRRDRIEAIIKTLHNTETVLRSQCAGMLDVKVERCFTLDSSLDLCRKSGSPHGFRIRTSNLPMSYFGRVCEHFYHHTSVRLLHRSALDFLTNDGRAKEFMDRATYPEGGIDGAFLRASRGVSGMLFRIIRDVAKSVSNADEVYDAMVLESLLSDQYDLYFEMLIRVITPLSTEERTKRFNSHCEWFTDVVSSVPRNKSSAAHSSSYEFSPLFGHSEIPPRSIALGDAVYRGAAELVPINVENDCKDVYSYISDSALAGLVRSTDTHDWKIQAKPNLNVIRTCLHAGLDPNAEVTGSRLKFSLCLWREIHSHCSTAWTNFLLGVIACSSYLERERDDRIAQEISSLVDLFLDHGADPNAYVLVEYGGIRGFYFKAKLPPLCILEDYYKRTRAGRHIIDRLRASGSKCEPATVKLYLIDERSKRRTHCLDLVTINQDLDLVSDIVRYGVSRYTYEVFWKANSGYITTIDSDHDSAEPEA